MWRTNEETTANHQDKLKELITALFIVFAGYELIQQVLEEPGWPERITPRDLAALSPLITQNINPHGRFELDMEVRLPLAA
ncbi:MAG: Tn3 family transposase [Geobacteraceae bacterium]|nr:Tn3 family transposase [Geobacteraceae bacterium]